MTPIKLWLPCLINKIDLDVVHNSDPLFVLVAYNGI